MPDAAHAGLALEPGRRAPRPSPRGAPSGPRASRGRAARGTPRAGRGVRARVHLEVADAGSTSAVGPPTTPAMTSLWPAEVLRRRLDDEVGAELERAGRGTARRTCCRRRTRRRARGRAPRARRGRRRRSSGWPIVSAYRTRVGRGGERRLDRGEVGRRRRTRRRRRAGRRSPSAGPASCRTAPSGRRPGRRPRGASRAPRGSRPCRRRRRAGLGALELGDGVAEGRVGRVVEPAVGVARARVADDVAELLGVVGRERHGLVDRDGGRLLVDDGLARRPGSRAWRTRVVAHRPAMLHRAAQPPSVGRGPPARLMPASRASAAPGRLVRLVRLDREHHRLRLAPARRGSCRRASRRTSPGRR